MTTLLYTHDDFYLHEMPAGHPECQERIARVNQALDHPDFDHLSRREAPEVAWDRVLLAHPESFKDAVRLAAPTEHTLVQLDPDTWMGPHSLGATRRSAGAGVAAVDAIMAGEAQNAFIVARPPGHHAEQDKAMGFCMFNSAAITALHAQQAHGCTRVAVVDFDVHHGNGTQEIFYEDPNVLYMSTHQWPLYPGTGALEETGTGAGEGATINIPLPAYTGDGDLIHVFKQILTPKALAFNPDLVIVSAGYDAHWMDPIGGMNITVSGFADIMQEILMWARECAGNRLIAALEGGYNTNALAHSVLTTIRLLQDPNATSSDPFGKSPRQDADLSDHLDELMAFYF